MTFSSVISARPVSYTHLDVYKRQALYITSRYVGEEPFSATTALYNQVLHRLLPPGGVAFHEIPRLSADDTVISASKVRNLIRQEHPPAELLLKLLPTSTYQYLLGAHLIH